ncbi:phage antirepressor KilAC domain-containing protein [Pediococcus parvulus]|uniref:phage antirepressor KilAC domain-containing protein n=1 Tax=Pediococcus parvulus TaxID=54062 RepID=UPI00345EAAD2
MNNLVVMKNQQAVTSSLQVAEVFGKNHQHILEAIDNLTVENSTVKSMFVEGKYENSRGREYRQVYMNRDGFTLLAMGFTGKKAMRFKLQYIEAFNQMEHQIQTGGFQIPHTMADALRLAADQADQIELMKPKVLFADSVATSKTTILIGELAKVLRGNGIDIGATRLFQWMRAKGYLISRKGTDWNMPTQKSMDLGLFKIKETSISHSDGSITVSKTTKVTGKGQQYFINKFLAIKS